MSNIIIALTYIICNILTSELLFIIGENRSMLFPIRTFLTRILPGVRLLLRYEGMHFGTIQNSSQPALQSMEIMPSYARS